MRIRNQTGRESSLTKYVIFSIVVLMLYYVIEFILSSTTGVSHDTITVSITATFGGEILSCALIKVFKLRRRDEF